MGLSVSLYRVSGGWQDQGVGFKVVIALSLALKFSAQK
ncbi:hypothetical protein M595_2653 [Lyngbya aestuarii BL J]|uniref:Uncharacterized protein n=1 Tax=Lyngbya aestuarii BL J TaxID=1348334 RepID=U7QK03_9CYAN|nr:hypothetical protein M595_2653 [Lyngbya aestuarii BL J]